MYSQIEIGGLENYNPGELFATYTAICSQEPLAASETTQSTGIAVLKGNYS